MHARTCMQCCLGHLDISCCRQCAMLQLMLCCSIPCLGNDAVLQLTPYRCACHACCGQRVRHSRMERSQRPNATKSSLILSTKGWSIWYVCSHNLSSGTQGMNCWYFGLNSNWVSDANHQETKTGVGNFLSSCKHDMPSVRAETPQHLNTWCTCMNLTDVHLASSPLVKSSRSL